MECVGQGKVLLRRGCGGGRWVRNPPTSHKDSLRVVYAGVGGGGLTQ